MFLVFVLGLGVCDGCGLRCWFVDLVCGCCWWFWFVG